MAQKKKSKKTKEKEAKTGTSRAVQAGDAPVRKGARRPARSASRKNGASERRRRGDGITKIKVVGVGGGGGNVISRMREQHHVRGVEYIAINTDVQDLEQTSAHRKVHIGKALTRGLGAGMNPDIGKQAAEENRSEIGEMLEGGDIVFVVAGFGGGTGSGAAPVIANIARQKGILTIGIVTKPFQFEGTRRMTIAQEAIERLRESVDAFVIVANDRVFSVVDREMPILKAFAVVDDIVKHAIDAIAELINMPGIINVDFADIDAVLRGKGASLIGVGRASGKDRSVRAVQAAVNSPLLEASIDGAKGLLFSIAGGRDLTMSEVHTIAKSIVTNLDPNAQIIFGAYYDRALKDKEIKVTVIATGFNHLVSTKGGGIPKLFDADLGEEGIIEEVTRADSREEKEKTEKRRDVAKDDYLDIPAFMRKKKK